MESEDKTASPEVVASVDDENRLVFCFIIIKFQKQGLLFSQFLFCLFRYLAFGEGSTQPVIALTPMTDEEL